MKLTRCDRHPDREAVATISIRIHSAGYRPILPSFGTIPAPRYFDMCSECRSSILFDGEDAAAAKAHSEHAL